MSWFLRGVQSAIFHYASCAPCTGCMYNRKRRKDAKQARKAKTRLVQEQPGLYHHPEPTGTNPYWQEEIGIGPGPPPRRAKRTNTSNTRPSMTTRTNDSAVSQAPSSIDPDRASKVRLSDDTLEDDDDNWNRKRYQREDEDLWGFGALEPLQTAVSASSVGLTGLIRPSTSRSGSYYSARAPPVNDLHPPVVSLPSPHPSDNQWMLQPPPKASVMSGKERATLRSRSGSGASSRVELSLQRQVSAMQLRHKLERGETPDRPPLSRGNSHNDMLRGQKHDRPKTPLTRPPSAASSYRPRRRRDTAMTNTSAATVSSDSSDTVIRLSQSPARDLSAVPSLQKVRLRSSRQQLSTVISSGSGDPSMSPTAISPTSELENENLRAVAVRRIRHSTQSTDSDPYHLKKHRTALTSSDIGSLNGLQNLVSPSPLLNSRLASAPLMDAQIKLPPSEHNEEKMLDTDPWSGSGFAISRGWGTEQGDGEARVPFDSAGQAERDPRMRWSVDF